MNNWYKLIYADRYDTTSPQYHNYYRGDLNTFVDCEYSWHETIESLVNEVSKVVSQYGENNVTLDYDPVMSYFRILIAV